MWSPRSHYLSSHPTRFPCKYTCNKMFLPNVWIHSSDMILMCILQLSLINTTSIVTLVLCHECDLGCKHLSSFSQPAMESSCTQGHMYTHMKHDCKIQHARKDATHLMHTQMNATHKLQYLFTLNTCMYLIWTHTNANIHYAPGHNGINIPEHMYM